MENRNVGYLLLGSALLMIVIVYMFNNALVDIVSASCSEVGHGDSCPMYDTISQQTNLALVIIGLLIMVSLYLIFSKPIVKTIIETKIIEKKKIKKKQDLSGLTSEEKKVFEIISESKAIFQANLIEKTEFGKAKITRIIDRLEGRGLVERKRRGMTNIVVLKD